MQPLCVENTIVFWPDSWQRRQSNPKKRKLEWQWLTVWVCRQNCYTDWDGHKMKSFKFSAALLALALLILLGVKLHRSDFPATGASPNLAQGVTGNPTRTLPASSNTRSNPRAVPANASVADADTPTLKAFPALAEFRDWATRFAHGENVDLAARINEPVIEEKDEPQGERQSVFRLPQGCSEHPARGGPQG